MIMALIFDLDGTIINVPASYLEDIHQKVRDRLCMDSMPDSHSENYWTVFDNIDLRMRPGNIKLFSDVDLSNIGNYKLGIVTSTHPEVAEQEMKELGIYSLFDTIVYAHRNSKYEEKPNPDGIREACNRLNVKPDDTVYFGDNNRDMLAARRANVFCVWVNRGQTYYDNSNYKKITPDMEIEGFEQILKVVQKIIQQN